jgi:Tol biopolymer transport system component
LLVRGGRAPVISPDGTSVAYVGGCNDEDVCSGTYVVSTSGGTPRRVSSDSQTFPPGARTWSRDSKSLVVWHAPSLVAIDVTTGKTSGLAQGGIGGWSFSPDGSQIVFARSRKDGKVNLFVVDADGGEPKRITETGDAASPVWGPDSIAYSKVIFGDSWGKSEVWRVQPDGSGRKTITGPLPAGFQHPGFDGLAPIAWSADGRALLAGLTTQAGAVPVAVDPTSGASRMLTHIAGVDTVGLSQDGKFVLAYEHPLMGEPLEENTAVLVVPYAGGKPTVVARGALSPSWNR